MGVCGNMERGSGSDNIRITLASEFRSSSARSHGLQRHAISLPSAMLLSFSSKRLCLRLKLTLSEPHPRPEGNRLFSSMSIQPSYPPQANELSPASSADMIQYIYPQGGRVHLGIDRHPYANTYENSLGIRVTRWVADGSIYGPGTREWSLAGGGTSTGSFPSPTASRGGNVTFFRPFIALYTRPSSSTWTTKVRSGSSLHGENDSRIVRSASPKSFVQPRQSLIWCTSQSCDAGGSHPLPGGLVA